MNPLRLRNRRRLLPLGLVALVLTLWAGQNLAARAGYDDWRSSPQSTNTAALRQLTRGGCCTQPFWTPDSQRVLFIDKPASQPLGIWGVGVSGDGPTLFSRRIAYYSPDLAYIIEPNQSSTVIERRSDGARWTVPTQGRPVTFSPSATRVAWQVSDQSVSFERRVSQIWVANVDGTNARQVAEVTGGSMSGWVSEDRMLMRSRATSQSEDNVIFTLSLVDGSTVELARTKRLQGASLSPDGKWVAYHVALSDVPGQNGLWVASTDGSVRRSLDRSFFGAYRWRDGGRLLTIPLKPDAVFHELWEYNAADATARQLTTVSSTRFKIANGDWAVSPNGNYVAYVESRDDNLWLIRLPE